MEPAEPILLLLYGGKSDRIKKRRNAQYNQQQRFLMYRFHVKDPVYYDRNFRMVLDNLGWTGPRYDNYTTVAYWYLDYPDRLPFGLPSDRELVMK